MVTRAGPAGRGHKERRRQTGGAAALQWRPLPDHTAARGRPDRRSKPGPPPSGAGLSLHCSRQEGCRGDTGRVTEGAAAYVTHLAAWLSSEAARPPPHVPPRAGEERTARQSSARAAGSGRCCVAASVDWRSARRAGPPPSLSDRYPAALVGWSGALLLERAPELAETAVRTAGRRTEVTGAAEHM